jgi:hypothetical protein
MTRGLAGTSPANVQNFLKGVDYPADKETLVETARKNQAPDEILDLLEEFPDQEYDSPVSVMKVYGEVHGSENDDRAKASEGSSARE